MERVLVASQNKIKALAVEDAFKNFLNNAVEVDLASIKIDSNVCDQPVSMEESWSGVSNRLDKIAGSDGYDYYVAIEGGMYQVQTEHGAKWFEAACAGVSHMDKVSFAFGSGYPVPNKLVEHVLAGHDLSGAMEKETGIKEIGKAGGFNGWLTDDKFDRRASSAQAVLLALYGLKHE